MTPRRRGNPLDVQSRVERLNPLTRGWAEYFNQGPVKRIYERIDKYVSRRLRIWLMRKRGKRATGYRRYSRGPLRRAGRRLMRLRSQASAVSGFAQGSVRHPQIAQSKQRRDLGGVFHQTTIPCLRVAKLPLEDMERVFDLGTDAGLQAFDLVVDRVQSITQVQFSAPAWSHRNMPAHRVREIAVAEGCIRSFMNRSALCQKIAAVPGIGPVTATAIVAAVGRPDGFRNRRHLAA